MDFGVGLTQVQRRIKDNVSLQWGWTDTVICWRFQFVDVVRMVMDCFSLGVGAWGHAGCGVSCQTLALDLK